MASITFSPKGTQLDNDEIADIQVYESDRFCTSFGVADLKYTTRVQRRTE